MTENSLTDEAVDARTEEDVEQPEARADDDLDDLDDIDFDLDEVENKIAPLALA